MRFVPGSTESNPGLRTSPSTDTRITGCTEISGATMPRRMSCSLRRVFTSIGVNPATTMSPSPGICTRPRASIRYSPLNSFSRHTAILSASPGRSTPTLRSTPLWLAVVSTGGTATWTVSCACTTAGKSAPARASLRIPKTIARNKMRSQKIPGFAGLIVYVVDTRQLDGEAHRQPRVEPFHTRVAQPRFLDRRPLLAHRGIRLTRVAECRLRRPLREAQGSPIPAARTPSKSQTTRRPHLSRHPRQIRVRTQLGAKWPPVLVIHLGVVPTHVRVAVSATILGPDARRPGRRDPHHPRQAPRQLVRNVCPIPRVDLNVIDDELRLRSKPPTLQPCRPENRQIVPGGRPTCVGRVMLSHQI